MSCWRDLAPLPKLALNSSTTVESITQAWSLPEKGIRTVAVRLSASTILLVGLSLVTASFPRPLQGIGGHNLWEGLSPATQLGTLQSLAEDDGSLHCFLRVQAGDAAAGAESAPHANGTIDKASRASMTTAGRSSAPLLGTMDVVPVDAASEVLRQNFSGVSWRARASITAAKFITPGQDYELCPRKRRPRCHHTCCPKPLTDR